MSVAEYMIDPDSIGIIGWQGGDDAIPNAITCGSFISDSADNNDDPHTRRVDRPWGQIALYRHRLSFTERARYRLLCPHVWIVSRRHVKAGEFHEWIYSARRRAEQQWTRTIDAAEGFGCLDIDCGCHSGPAE